jgi:hypothetical protein
MVDLAPAYAVAAYRRGLHVPFALVRAICRDFVPAEPFSASMTGPVLVRRQIEFFCDLSMT